MKLLTRLFIIFFVLTLLVSGGLWVFGKAAGLFSSEGASELTSQPAGELSFQKGFDQDSDNDGLSDAKEQIFGSDANNPDTDGDTFRDGDEVGNGYDPTTSGSMRIADNPKLNDNLTIQYFEWGREKLGEKDIKLDEEKIVQFLEERGIAKIQIPEVADGEIKKSSSGGQEALTQYLTALAAIQLPEETASFVDLAENLIQTQKTELLDKVIAGLIATQRQFAGLAVPQEAVAVHKGYMGMTKALMNLFTDLYTIERDPVKLMRDVRWGNDLVTHAVEIEKQRAELARFLDTNNRE